MRRLIPPLLIFQIVLFICTSSSAQSPFYSESLIKYDLLTHKTDKPIPFDRSFTLVIEKLSSKNVEGVHAYEAEFKNGNRKLVKNIFLDCANVRDTVAIKDVILNWNRYSDTLQIFFPPLKPNSDFDINVIYSLSKDCLPILMKVNAKLADGTPDAVTAASDLFDALTTCTYDQMTNRTYLDMDFAQYQVFYRAQLSPTYINLGTAGVTTTGTLAQDEIQAIDITTTAQVNDFKDGSLLQECLAQGYFPDIQTGTVDISKVFQNGARTTLFSGSLRSANLESNLKFIDSLLRRVDRVISKGIINQNVNGTNVVLSTVRTHIETLRTNMRSNLVAVNNDMSVIDAAIKNETRLKQGIYLVGNTLSSDLKSAGGSILFLDAGITNIIAEGIDGKAVHLPKFYWGVSIYFRPIDKNTRRSRFPKKFDPPYSKGCTVDAHGNFVYGPDYEIVTRKTILQHLSLNVGLTFGSMVNKDFDNFYNNTSLLVGPAYRFARGFKVSTGVALLRRSSKNPIISEKKTIPGGYISLSVDIDLIQGIKDFTSILFK